MSDPSGAEVAVAFGRRGVEKLIDLIKSHDTPNDVKRLALDALAGEVATQEKKAEAIRGGGVDAATALLRSPDGLCKASAAVVLSKLFLVMQGREAAKSAGSVLALSTLCADGNAAVQRGANAALVALTGFRDGWSVFVETEKAVELVVGALPVNPPAVAVLVNVTAFYTAGSAAALEAGVTRNLVALLQSRPDAEVLSNTALTLRHLAMHEVGKEAAIKEGAVAELVSALTHGSPAVRCNVTGALALIGIALEAKRQFASCGPDAVRVLRGLVADGDADTAANARAAVDALSELPSLRDAFATVV